LSRRLCILLGGDISVESTLGSGSTFTIRIPENIAATHSMAADPRRGAAWNCLDEAPLMNADLSSISTVLVVDDDPATRDLLERSLSAADLSVVTVDNAEDGILLAQALCPDVVIMDVVLPDKDGWAVLAAIKADPELADIPVIMLTIVDDRGKGVALGATEYLIKPVDSEQLIKLVRSYLRRNSSSQRNNMSIADAEDEAALWAEAQLSF
jgi:CheY-like chemotaxis protein